MNIRFTKAPTFTKAIIGAAVFTIVYLASTSNLPSCGDTMAVLNSGTGECIERQSFLHTASGWLALICVIAAVVLLALKHKETILGRLTSVQQAYQGSSATPPPQQQADQRPQAPERGSSSFCAKCGTRIIAGDRFCQGCGVTVASR
jgi:hypothetical protein